MVKETFSVAIDSDIKNALDEAVRKGRFGANRSQAVEYCIKQVLRLESGGERHMEFLIEFLERLEGHPEVKEQLREFLQQKKEDSE